MSIAPAPLDRHAGRLPVLGLLAATALAGMLFGPVFGAFFATAVVLPVAAVTATAYACHEAAHHWSRLERWRPGLSALLGALAIVETTLRGTTRHGLPTMASARALDEGVRKSWLLTLQSTWPARPEAQLVVFVPILVLVAAVIGVQILQRTRARLMALTPSLAVAGLAQAYHPLSGGTAVPVVLAYGFAIVLVLSSLQRSNLRFAAVAIPLVAGCAFAGAAVDPAARGAYSLQNDTPPAAVPIAVTSPLDEIAYRLEHPRTKLFTVHGSTNTDRWPLAVFDTFDGANWGTDAHYRVLGRRLDVDPTASRVSTSQQDARIDVTNLPGPWLPSQRGLRSVSGVAPLVDQDTGTLLDERTKPGTGYSLHWATPNLSGSALAHAALASNALGQTGNMGAVPSAIRTVAKTALGSAPPSFQTALVLERYLREHYRLAVGQNLPAGHGWPQLVHFLVGSGSSARPSSQPSGTSEQFAAAYVVLARVSGIPARLVVGFRQPRPQPDGSYVVRNADVLAWPEVAVQGAGWIPLDPSGIAQDTGSSHNSTALAKATDQARAQLPPPSIPKKSKHHHGPKQSAPVARARHPSHGWPGVEAGAVLLAGVLAWLIIVPVVKELRNGVRRRRTGNAAVVAAWLETRDRLRDHGVVVEPGMTIRDVGRASQGLISRAALHAIEQLGTLVDVALWSGNTVSGRTIDIAWQACDGVRHSLTARPISERLAATVGLRSLRAPR